MSTPRTPYAPVPHLPGAYVMRHSISGLVLIGSARDLERRRQQHLNLLQAGLHESSELQELYTADPYVEFEFFASATLQEALQKEASLLAEYEPSGRLVNIDAHCKQTSFTPRKTFNA